MRNFFIYTIILFSILSNAQEKTSIGILPFTYVNGASNQQTTNSIQETVTNGFVKTKRFNIVDRTKMDALRSEKKLQKSEDFIDAKTYAEQGVSLGAQYLVSGHVVSANAEQMRADDGAITYKTKLSINLKVIDVATGQVVSSETIEPKSGSSLLGAIGLGASSPEASIAKAIKGIEEKVDDFVSRNFPISFFIAEIQEKDSKGAAVRLMIAGGSEFGLSKGDKLKVVEISVMEVGGKKLTRKKEVGELKITKVEDENFSTCSVNSGGVDIATKFEAKANLQVVTK
ncbi:CsgG/HfaB family protein [uncultured Flavobacterium sp.]|uniref:CsgG/HfaB family protein n=1 Tax=uncultured Flavobacterium sp. TaxID=165435 RepID=UPI00261A4183|nr:CsgG/HfaB family protein [uncultured Flavobacterium sp.]